MHWIPSVGEYWQPASLPHVPPLSCVWLGFGDFTQWHVDMARRFNATGDTPGSSPLHLASLNKTLRWGYHWMQPSVISDPYACYDGEECEIAATWSKAGYHVGYRTLNGPSRVWEEKPRLTTARLQYLESNLTVTFRFSGPAVYHLEFQQEFWAAPIKTTVDPTRGAEAQFWSHPIKVHGFPAGLVRYVKGTPLAGDH